MDLCPKLQIILRALCWLERDERRKTALLSHRGDQTSACPPRSPLSPDRRLAGSLLRRLTHSTPSDPRLRASALLLKVHGVFPSSKSPRMTPQSFLQHLTGPPSRGLREHVPRAFPPQLAHSARALPKRRFQLNKGIQGPSPHPVPTPCPRGVCSSGGVGGDTSPPRSLPTGPGAEGGTTWPRQGARPARRPLGHTRREQPAPASPRDGPQDVSLRLARPPGHLIFILT